MRQGVNGTQRREGLRGGACASLRGCGLGNAGFDLRSTMGGRYGTEVRQTWRRRSKRHCGLGWPDRGPGPCLGFCSSAKCRPCCRADHSWPVKRHERLHCVNVEGLPVSDARPLPSACPWLRWACSLVGPEPRRYKDWACGSTTNSSGRLASASAHGTLDPAARPLHRRYRAPPERIITQDQHQLKITRGARSQAASTLAQVVGDPSFVRAPRTSAWGSEDMDEPHPALPALVGAPTRIAQ